MDEAHIFFDWEVVDSGFAVGGCHRVVYLGLALVAYGGSLRKDPAIDRRRPTHDCNRKTCFPLNSNGCETKFINPEGDSPVDLAL
jgi:hypothetical protein